MLPNFNGSESKNHRKDSSAKQAFKKKKKMKRVCYMRCSSTSQRLLILTLNFHTGTAPFPQCAVSAYNISECHSQLASLPPLLHLLLPFQQAVIHAQGTFILKPELPVTLTKSSAPIPSCSLAKPHSQNQWHSLPHHQR